MKVFKKIMSKLIEVLSLKLRLLFLIKFRIKMYFEAKKYAKKYKEGTIKFLKIDGKTLSIEDLNDKKIILFVVYSPKSYLLYERYFDLLEQLGYEIVVISNGGLPQEFIDIFKDRVIGMGERNNIGRDFGTYKEFILSLKNKNINLKNLIICNDSIFTNLRKNDNRFAEFVNANSEKDFLGAAEYMGNPGYHVQSYFLMFSENVLKGKNFSNFWTNFLISDDRRSNIHNGEIKLSEAILADGFTPTIFLSTDKVLDTIMSKEDNLSKLIMEMSFNPHIDPAILERIKDLYLENNSDDSNSAIIQLNNSAIRRILSSLINKYGMIICAPFFIINEFGFPFLKRDLVYRQVTEWMEIRNMSASFDSDLLEEYLKDQRIRKRAWNLNSLSEKLMYQTGMN